MVDLFFYTSPSRPAAHAQEQGKQEAPWTRGPHPQNKLSQSPISYFTQDVRSGHQGFQETPSWAPIF